MTPAREIAGLRYQPTSLVIGKRLTLAHALEIATSLGAMAQGHQWWIGDLLVAVDERFGEDGSQVEHALGIAPQTALNYRWVASRIQASRRRETLTWSHHAEVARLEPDDQDAALEHAIADSLGVRELRDYVALTYGDGPRDTSSPPAPATDHLTDAELDSIARRLDALLESYQRWREHRETDDEAGLLGYVDEEDVDWLLRTLRWVTRGGAKP